MPPPSADTIQANAVSFLIQGQEFDEAGLLLLCEMTVSQDRHGITTIELASDRTLYDIFHQDEHPSANAISYAIEAALPVEYRNRWSIRASLKFPSLGPDWRSELLEVVQRKGALNQCVPIKNEPTYPWEYLHFRAPVEITIAKALDKYQVLFLPNCMARLGLSGNRENREADFLVCYEGKWGIIEVDGNTYHTNAAKDHERSRLFKAHGIRVFEHYEAKRCLSNPEGVVKEFLNMLKKNG